MDFQVCQPQNYRVLCHLKALVSTLHNILQLMEGGFDVSLVFDALRKVFDSVHHLALLHKQDIGLNQHISQWIASYLCNR